MFDTSTASRNEPLKGMFDTSATLRNNLTTGMFGNSTLYDKARKGVSEGTKRKAGSSLSNGPVASAAFAAVTRKCPRVQSVSHVTALAQSMSTTLNKKDVAGKSTVSERKMLVPIEKVLNTGVSCPPIPADFAPPDYHLESVTHAKDAVIGTKTSVTFYLTSIRPGEMCVLWLKFCGCIGELRHTTVPMFGMKVSKAVALFLGAKQTGKTEAPQLRVNVGPERNLQCVTATETAYCGVLYHFWYEEIGPCIHIKAQRLIHPCPLVQKTDMCSTKSSTIWSDLAGMLDSIKPIPGLTLGDVQEIRFSFEDGKIKYCGIYARAGSCLRRDLY